MVTRRTLLQSLLLAPTSSAFAGNFVDPLDSPARSSGLASRSLLLGVASAGNRVVAVGQRGHIVYSDDNGNTWQQAAVPVASDLTSVHFVGDRLGWAVGHDAVILHTRDGGVSWAKQMDGRQANQRIEADLQAKVKAQPQDERLDRLLVEARRNTQVGPDKPLMDIWFANERVGYAVGAYNLIFRTTDGGKNWMSWFDRTDNPALLHFNTVRGVGDRVYLAGERGMVLHLDEGQHRFIERSTSYKGSLFAMAVDARGLQVMGMRGTALFSRDEGASWREVQTGIQSALSGASVMADGRLVVISSGGKVLQSDHLGERLSVVSNISPMGFSGVCACGPGLIALAGTHGVRIEVFA